MAQDHLKGGENPETLQFAQQIIDAQEVEIAQIEDVLQAL